MNFIIHLFLILTTITAPGLRALQAQQFTHLNYPDTAIVNQHVQSVTTTYTGNKFIKKALKIYAPNGNCTQQHEWRRDGTDQHYYFFYKNNLVDSIYSKQKVWVHNSPVSTTGKEKELGTYTSSKLYSYNPTADTITVLGYPDKMVPGLYTFVPVKYTEGLIIIKNDNAGRPLQVIETMQPQQFNQTLWSYDKQGRTTQLIYSTYANDTLTRYLENTRIYYDSIRQVYHTYKSNNGTAADSGTTTIKLNSKQQFITLVNSNGTHSKYRWYKNGLLKSITTYKGALPKGKSRYSYVYYRQ